MNLPNKITISRICLIPLVLFFFLADFIPYGKLVAALIFGIAAITDNIDGRIARKRNLVTDLGKFLDPIADKVLVATGLLLIVAYPITALGGIREPMAIVQPAWLGIVCAVLMLARELIISAFRQIAATKNLVMAADKSGKIKAFFQDITIFLYMIFAFMVAEFYPTIQGTAYTVINIVLLVLLVVTTILTITSGINYIIKNKSVLKAEKAQEPKMRYDMIIPSVLKEFIEEGVVSAGGIAERFNIDEKRANKIVADMQELGYISDEEGTLHEILMSEEEYRETFED